MYLLLDKNIDVEGFQNDVVILMPRTSHQSLFDDKKIMVQILLIPSNKVFEKLMIEKEDLTFAGFAISEKLE